MTKVFHIISHIDIGGAEKVAFNIACCKNNDIEQHIVEVVSSQSSYRSMFKKDMSDNGIKYHCASIGNNKLAIMLFPLFFLYLSLRYRPNIIHTHTEIPDLAIFIWHKLFGWTLNCKYVRTIHNTQLWNSWSGIGKIVERFFQKHKSNIAISKSVQSSYKTTYGEECPIIYNGLPIVAQQPFEYIVPNKTNILFAGRLEYQKGVEELGRVIVQLKDNANIYFHIIGSGSLKDDLLSQICNCSNYMYYEKVYNLASYLSSFDYLFMPSNFEGLALMPIEAAMAKLLCIANNCPGLGETLPKNWPLLVQNNNIDDYIKIFNNVDSINRDELKETIFNHAIEKFSIETMQKQYIELYGV